MLYFGAAVTLTSSAVTVNFSCLPWVEQSPSQAPYSMAALKVGAKVSPFCMDLTFTVTFSPKEPGTTDG